MPNTTRVIMEEPPPELAPPPKLKRNPPEPVWPPADAEVEIEGIIDAKGFICVCI